MVSCGSERVRARTRAIKELYPETYWRPLTAGQPEACPELYCTSTDDMVAVPGGNAVFGCTASDGCEPKKSVKELASFEIDRTEVTRGAYARCVSSKECKPLFNSTPDSVAAMATYVQAWQYCASQGKRVVPALRVLWAHVSIQDRTVPNKVAKGRATRDLEAALELGRAERHVGAVAGGRRRGSEW
jgi:formylglycine-generating enzyme required for sulfatase activity